jgi:hypothetical protein
LMVGRKHTARFGLGIGFNVLYPTSDPVFFATLNGVRKNIVSGNWYGRIIVPRDTRSKLGV